MIDNIKITNTQILSDNWYHLKKVTYSYTKQDGSVHVQSREAYDRGNGAAILLYNTVHKTVIMTRQFRLPTYINGNPTGMMIEACAGLLDMENPEECIVRETEEETGYTVTSVQKVFEAYMSPGSVTEILYFFVAEYDAHMKTGKGGGAEHEEENIEVLEIKMDEALLMISDGRIRDGKTIMLLQYLRSNSLV